MRRISVTLLTMLVAGAFTLVSFPDEADAAIKLGADAIWVPVAADTVKRGGTTLDSSHELTSFGGAAHLNFGFDIFALGLKVNYFNEGLKVEDSGTNRRDEVDINGLFRVGVPATKLAFFGEAGPSISTKFDGLGYNAGVGAEYTLFSVAIADFNLGVEGQYVTLPFVTSGESRTKRSGRLNVFFGADFGL